MKRITPFRLRRRRYLWSAIQVGMVFALAIGLLPSPQASAAIVTRAGSTTTTFGASSGSIAKPSGTVTGDLMVAAITVRLDSASYSCTGGMRGYRISGGSLGSYSSGVETSFPAQYTAMLRHVATASEPSSYTISLWVTCNDGIDTQAPLTAKTVAGLTSFGGVGSYELENRQTQTGTTITAPSVTTLAAATRIVTVYTLTYGSTITLPGGVSSLYTTTSSGGAAGTKIMMSVGTFDQASAGATSAQSATAGDSANNVGIQFALHPPLPVSITQGPYRWFANNNSTNPGSPLALENTSATIEQGTPFRLRQRLAVDTNTLPATGQSFKLRYAEKAGTCGVYYDVGTGIPQSLPYYATSSVDKNNGQDLSWVSPSNAAGTTDGLVATVSSTTLLTHMISNNLYVSGYGFSIPTDATITGISLTLSGGRTDSGTVTRYTALTKDGSTLTPTIRSKSIPYPAGGSAFEGSSTELWGTTWTPAEINSSSFGALINADVYFQNSGEGGPTTYSLNSVQITVHYSLPTQPMVKYYDNASVASGATIASVAGDPANAGRTAVYQVYQESSILPFANPAAIASGQDGLWDFSLTTNDGTAGKTYCFQVTKEDGSSLTSYSVTPEIIIGTVGQGPSLEQQLRGGQSVINGSKLPFSL